MDWSAIILIGIVATGYLTLVTVGASHLGIVRGSMLQAIGSFFIPEPMRRPALSLVMHVLAGIGFTAVYAYIFDFVRPDTIRDFMSIGVLVGLVHGFFVSYFMLLGFSALQPGEDVRPFSFSAALLNVVAHITFGLAVGLGLGYAALGESFRLFAAYSLAMLGGIVGLMWLLGPVARPLTRRFSRRRREGRGGPGLRGPLVFKERERPAAL